MINTFDPAFRLMRDVDRKQCFNCKSIVWPIRKTGSKNSTKVNIPG